MSEDESASYEPHYLDHQDIVVPEDVWISRSLYKMTVFYCDSEMAYLRASNGQIY